MGSNVYFYAQISMQYFLNQNDEREKFWLVIQIQLTERPNQSRSLDKHNIMSIKTLFYCDSSDAHSVKKKKKA